VPNLSEENSQRNSKLRDRGEKEMNKRQNIRWTLGLVSFLFILGSPFTGGADSGAIPLGLHPYITVQEEYSSNIFLTKRDKVYDFITTVNPGLKFSALSEKNYGIDLDILAAYTYYAKNHDLSYFSPSGTLNAWYAMSQNLTFRVRDYLIRSDEGREQAYSSGAQPDQFVLSTVRGQKAIYIRNVVEPAVEYHFGKEDSLSILYRNNFYHNDNALFEDSQENTINPRFTYWFDIRNGVALEYFLTYGSYARSPGQVAEGVRARYTYRFSRNTSIFGEYAFEKEHFESPGDDYHIHSPNIGIEYKFSPTLTGTAQGGYFWQLSNQGSETSGPSYNVSLTKTAQKTAYTLAFQGGYTEDYFTAQNLGLAKYYRAYGTVNHQLTEKTTVGLTGSVERATFSSDQKDWIWGIWGSLSYRLFKWMTVAMEVSYREDHSNIDTASYSEYRGILRLTAAY
jgi:hypothetical protein